MSIDLNKLAIQALFQNTFEMLDFIARSQGVAFSTRSLHSLYSEAFQLGVYQGGSGNGTETLRVQVGQSTHFELSWKLDGSDPCWTIYDLSNAPHQSKSPTVAEKTTLQFIAGKNLLTTNQMLQALTLYIQGTKLALSTLA